METRIFLEKHRNKRSVNTSSGLKIDMVGVRKLLPTSEFDADISEFEQYKEERARSSKFRFTFQVNPLCTNVLHNKITEIVKDEGSSKVQCLNFDVFDGIPSFFSDSSLTYRSTYEGISITLPSNENHPTNAIRNTSISNSGYVYHCGSDIFNNHLLRSKTFKAVCKSGNTQFSDAVNTITDSMRDTNGNEVKESITFPTSAGVVNNYKKVKLHLYEYDDILSYKDCLATKLRSLYNGWVGFDNTSKIKTYENFDGGVKLNIERPIMYMNGGNFIDMYPSRDLYSFIPKYNKFRHRIEKNWNYCLTYPSSSTTKGFDDIINPSIGSMKALFFTENAVADNGTKQVGIFSIAKHGLVVGDSVNIYKTYENEDGERVDEKVMDSAKVISIIDEYLFTLSKTTTEISSGWHSVEEMREMEGYRESSNKQYFLDEENNKYYVWDGYVNIDPTAQSISYKKVVNDVECNYYVRIFSRIPNFKYAEEATKTQNDIYKDNAAVLKKYQAKEYDFTSEVSKLAFAKNIYSDEIGQIVYTDDIDLANLKDNLGRPLTSIFLTIVKNNKGYKQWYGFDGVAQDITSEEIEFSHCFGKITCGIETSFESRNDAGINSIHSISNSNIPYGFDISYINNRENNYTEILFDTDTNFYGDIACYDSFNAKETSLQPILHRFNTAQRESIKSSTADKFKEFFYDEITNDDYDRNDKFVVTAYKSTKIMSSKCNNLNEGYYYKPHYEIKVRTEGELRSVMPDFLPIRSMVSVSSETRFNVSVYPYLSVGDKCMLFDKNTKKLYYCTVTGSDASNLKTFTCMITNEDGTMADDLANITQGSSDEERLRYKLFKIDNLDIPTYARPMTDGTCRMIWRDIFNNGSGNFVKDNEYVFTNGAFYINMGINLFVRRQDPDGIYGLYSNDDIIGEALDYDSEDTYYTEENITC